MAKVTPKYIWFMAVALIFLPLTGKYGIATSAISDCKSQDTIYRFQVNRFLIELNTAY